MVSRLCIVWSSSAPQTICSSLDRVPDKKNTKVQGGEGPSALADYQFPEVSTPSTACFPVSMRNNNNVCVNFSVHIAEDIKDMKPDLDKLEEGLNAVYLNL